MTSNTTSFVNTPLFFKNNSFNIWQARFKFFLQSINHDLWRTIVNGPIYLTHQVNDEVMVKPYSFWTK